SARRADRLRPRRRPLPGDRRGGGPRPLHHLVLASPGPRPLTGDDHHRAGGGRHPGHGHRASPPLHGDRCPRVAPGGDPRAPGGPAGGMTDNVFAALADPTRRTVFSLLVESGPASATRLADRLPVSRQAVAKHLAVLEDAGLVTRERAGRETRFAA